MTIELDNKSNQITDSNHAWGIAALLVVTLIWGSSFPVIKGAVSNLSPAVIVATRFAVAALPFTLYLRFLNISLLRDGVLLGLIIFSAYTIQTVALETAHANHAAFIASFNVILVPLLGQLLGRQVFLKTFLTAGIAILGVGVMCWESQEIVMGDFLMLVDALLYSIYILKLDSIAWRYPILPLGAIQLWVIAIVSLIWAAPDLVRQQEVIVTNLGPLLYLGFVATAVPVVLKVIGQRWVNAYETALIYTLEPIFAAVFSFFLMGEKLGVRGFIGAALVIAAMVLAQSNPQNTNG